MREITVKDGSYTDMMEYSIPLFFAGILLDLLASYMSPKSRQKRSYRINDSINSISCGLMSQLIKIHAKWIVLLPYTYVYRNFAIYRAPLDSTWVWILVLLGVDLGYYCGHRASHTISIGWLAHAAHHSSEDMNLTTALRQSIFGNFFFFVFYLPLALFFPPYLYTTHHAINLIYQFWIHTDKIQKLHPAFEFIFNTPSHHRVHHARNPQYIDKNYAGMLIIWDRMFGTFEEEKEQPVYGLVHQLGTWDILWAQLHHLFVIIDDVSRARGISNKIKIALAGPGWTLAKDGRTWVAHELPAIDWKQPKYDPYVPASVTWYVFAQFLVTIFFSTIFLKTAKYMSFNLSLFVTFYIVFCLEVYGLTFNRSQYSRHLEVARIFITFGLSLHLMQCYLSEVHQYYAVLASGMFIGISLKMFEAIQSDWQFVYVPLHKSMD